MSWLSDTYADLKAKWQRFKQWQRLTLLRETEWRFPIQGSVEGLETRFKRLVPVVSRDEFFRLYRKRKNPRVFGFFASDELAIKTPNQTTANAARRRARWRRSVHYFHGILTHDGNDLWLVGHYRLPRKRADRMLGWINGTVVIGIALLFCVLTWANGKFLLSVLPIGLLIPIPLLTYALAVTLMAYVVCLIFAVPGLVMTKLLDRPARAETHRLLQDICGNLAKEPAE